MILEEQGPNDTQVDKIDIEFWKLEIQEQFIIQNHDNIIKRTLKLRDEKQQKFINLHYEFPTTKDFLSQEDDALLQDLLKICIIESPALHDSFRFMRTIGKGSQGEVSLYEHTRTEQ